MALNQRVKSWENPWKTHGKPMENPWNLEVFIARKISNSIG